MRAKSLFLLLALCVEVPALSARGAEPVPLIFDTDCCGDCDDVLALAMIHALQSRGACRLEAVTISEDNPKVAPFVAAVNAFYGRGTIPVGLVRGGPKTGEGKFLHLPDILDDGRPRYPHQLDQVHDATALLRRTLARLPGGSAVVVQVGFSTNLARLLNSKPDEESPLDGVELVRRKVKLLSIMAGSFAPIPGHERFLEYNVTNDIEACRTLADRWPTPIVWSGFEIGINLPYPHESIERDFGYVPHHPAAEAYIAYMPPPHDRPTWDLTSVLYAVYPDRGYFDLSPPGAVTVEPDGLTRFEAGGHGRHRHLVLRPEQKARVTEALVQLSSQPPGRGE